MENRLLQGHTVVSLPYYPIHLKEKIISKLIQKSKVVYLRCQKVGQYCKPYLKYWPQGVNDPLELSGGQKIQWFIKWKGLLVSGGVYNRVQINSILKINILNPFTYSLRDQKIFFGILLCALPEFWTPFSFSVAFTCRSVIIHWNLKAS